MKYFGSAILLADMSSSSPISTDLPKIIGPSLFPCMTTSVVLILMMSLLSSSWRLQVYAPLPDWSAFAAEWPDNLAGPGPGHGDRIEGHSIGLVLEVPTYQIQMFEMPPSGVLWHPKWIWWHAPHLIRDIWRWYVKASRPLVGFSD
jgi:hypothetical protein